MHKPLDIAVQVFSGWKVTAVGFWEVKAYSQSLQGIGHSKAADPEQMKSASLN